MRKSLLLLAAWVLVLMVAGCGRPISAVPPQHGANTHAAQSIGLPANVVRACDEPVAIGYAKCDALIRTDVGGTNAAPEIGTSTTRAFGPADLHSAYKLSTTAGRGQTIGIVDAFNDPTAESDLAVYRRRFDLTPCTTDNGCFKKVNQRGERRNYPPTDDSWAVEISLDLDMVSAICQHCKILLVETVDNRILNLVQGVDTAAALGANAISNSYTTPEGLSELSDYNHPGHIIVAGAGDDGVAAGPQQPCSFATVVCVGGTHLQRDDNERGWKESAWTGSGSGCSALVAKPSWQTDRTGVHCTNRSESDVSAVADPNPGLYVYDTTPVPGSPKCTPPNCFYTFGGTSASTPIVAAAYGLAGNAALQTAAKSIWKHPGSFFDVETGSNGTCSIFYICHAGEGYDGPTGIGTPNGIGGL